MLQLSDDLKRCLRCLAHRCAGYAPWRLCRGERHDLWRPTGSITTKGIGAQSIGIRVLKAMRPHGRAARVKALSSPPMACCIAMTSVGGCSFGESRSREVRYCQRVPYHEGRGAALGAPGYREWRVIYPSWVRLDGV